MDKGGFFVKKSARKKNMRRVSLLVTAQTAWNLEHLAKMERCGTGRVVDKLVRDRMVSLKEVRNLG
jgi:hypothetical protein